MEREQFKDDELWLKIQGHIEIIRRYFLVIPALAVLGFLIGAGIQWIAKDKYVEEVLISDGDRFYLIIVRNYLQPTALYFFNSEENNRRNASGSIGTQASNGDLVTGNSSASVILKAEPAVRVDLTGPVPELAAVNLETLKRVANGRDSKLAAITSLDKNDPLRLAVNRSNARLESVLNKFKISMLSPDNEENKTVLISFEGDSTRQAASVVENLVTNLKRKFVELEKQQISGALQVKLIVLDAQIVSRKDFLAKMATGRQDSLPKNSTNDAMNSDPLLIALNSDRKRIEDFSVDDVDIKPFSVVPTNRFKKFRVTGTVFWLFLTTIGGLLFGILCCYAFDRIRTIRAGIKSSNVA